MKKLMLLIIEVKKLFHYTQWAKSSTIQNDLKFIASHRRHRVYAVEELRFVVAHCYGNNFWMV